MTSIFKHTIAGALMGTAFALSSCSDNEVIPDRGENGHMHTIELKWHGSRPTFEGNRKSRAASSSYVWKTGDILNLQFTANGNTSYGTATYDATSGKWLMQYNGSMPQVENGHLVAYFFENPAKRGNATVDLGPHAAVYADTVGVFSYDGTTLNASASLVPAVSRIRLQGSPGDTIYVNELTVSESYNVAHEISTYKVRDIPLIVSSKTDTDGKYYTDYVYLSSQKGARATDSNRSIAIVNHTDAYTHKLSESNLAPGKSGYLTMPGLNGSANWMKISPFSNIKLPDSIPAYRRNVILAELDEMVMVKGGRMKLGNNELTVHMYPFYIMRKEVSNQLYEAIMGKEPTYCSLSISGDKRLFPLDGGTKALPTGALSYEDGVPSMLEEFLIKLNQMTGLHFDLPCETEWEYAARGGQSSKGYSNIGGVRSYLSYWENIPSLDGKSGKHQVDEGPINELGLYGLCSNVSEACYYVRNYSDLGTFDFAVISAGENGCLISWRGATSLDAQKYTDRYSPLRCGHASTSGNYYRGLRLVLRYQDNF